ncbi:succinate dehydrogenase, cytochrome b556 subunit [Marinicella gelatinilytica]|uniref:succinate dehydrogenase, cytochrome b556 subunit n=1 Tax=Marinicella gelatinilytica TaxID=2996017 RepID=UPI002260833B|nr:succinate dehydrogenase, cytochrome b556 subunit [Marinicella gelatinilytica]MCX7546026.1 succinate dehydrogenase, cytochrome b556 subunit [Marinicella gelatinilytica]
MSSSNRPLSPHLQVYKFPLTVKTSILHRITGMLLAFGLVIFVYWLYALATDVAAADQLRSWLLSVPGQILVYLWLYTFFYHFCNGIRHLFWDVGKGFSNEQARRSAMVVLIVPLLLTIGTYVLAQ